MPRPAQIPEALLRGPFHVDDAAAVGVTHDRLRGAAYRRLLPRVWVVRTHVMSEPDWHQAALLYAPDDACLTGVTRLQQLGLDIGPHRPLQLVVARDLHRTSPDVFIHRTDVMPEHRGRLVSPLAAWVEACRTLSLLDAVAAGDWLRREHGVDTERFRQFCTRDHWREGVPEAWWVWPLLDPGSRSPQESRIRTWMHAAGLPRPESNAEVRDRDRLVAIVDWWWRTWRLAAEYEGLHHQVDRHQYVADIDRYRRIRSFDAAYVQITRELYAMPRTMIRRIHEALVERGYDGPAPTFGAATDSLTLPVARAMTLAPRLSPAGPRPLPPARR